MSDNVECEQKADVKVKDNKNSNENTPKGLWREIFEWGACVVIAVALALAVRYFIGTPTIVQHPSMTPTLLSGDRLLLNRLDIKLGKEIKRGDIITFEAPLTKYVPAYEADSMSCIAEYDNTKKGIFSKFMYYVLEIKKTSYIKRVIALPGEHIKIEKGVVYINDEVYDEPYLPEGTETTDGGGFFLDLVVPEGTLFVMGDNRGNSTDSRAFGCIPIDKVESKVFIRFWPFNKFGEVE